MTEVVKASYFSSSGLLHQELNGVSWQGRRNSYYFAGKTRMKIGISARTASNKSDKRSNQNCKKRLISSPNGRYVLLS
ncbi:hypothetical protein JTB14_017202 [Gonioctena quinquepunctata]|nr:hypothetical protein JTB14_017202 [Gonioctena quinquepunctata]